MYKTKKDVDTHVRTALAKVRSETERNLRSFTIAKLYYKINEYSTAEQYLNAYLSVKEDNDQAHKLLGQCYQRLKKSDKALAAYQRSLQLNLKQPDILIEVCKLLLEDDNINVNKAKYWYELAESENVQHDAVFSLRLKLLNNENVKMNHVEGLIQKEISNRPHSVQLHVRLVRHYIEQKQILNAFKYVKKLEMQQRDEFTDNDEWYNIVWLMLKKYEEIPNKKKDWDFWVLVIMCLERLVYISLLYNGNAMSSSCVSAVVGGGIVEEANHLFDLDQYLFKCAECCESINGIQKEFLDLFIDHFCGQFLLHAVTLLFKRELLYSKNKWKEIVQAALPLLLLGVQIKPFRNEEPWMKHIDGQCKQLLLLWQREGSFRCAQIGRTLLSCIDNESSDFDEQDKPSAQFAQNHFFALQTYVLWQNSNDLLAQARRTCSDAQWRRNIFALLFCNSDQKVKEQSSFLINNSKLSEPRYELPSFSDLERYEETAQYLRPQSLQYMVYLNLPQDDLAQVRASYFSGLPFSTENLSFCGAESLNQLDVDSFLYAAIIQAQRVLVVERENLESITMGTADMLCKPRILPFANIKDQLCTEEQIYWWSALYAVYKNLSNGNDLAELRSTLQYGIEAVRGINGPKVDMTIVFKLGKALVSRSQDTLKPIEKSFLEARAEAIFKCGLNMLKLHNKGVLEPFRRYFKYVKIQASNVEKQVFNDAEEAVSYLAGRYFKRAAFEDFIDELTGVQLPFSTYLQAEAYRKLNEISKTPKKVKHSYLDKCGEYLQQSLALLKSTAHVNPNHPLNSIVPNEIKRLQLSTANLLYDSSPLSNNFSPYNNSSTYEDAEDNFYAENSIRGRREIGSIASNHHHQQEIENLVKQVASTLVLLKEEIVETIKPEIQTLSREITNIKSKMESKDALKPELQMVSKEITSIKDKISSLEEAMRKVRVSSNPPSRDDGSNVLDDLYIFEDAFQQQLYQTPQNTQTSNVANVPNTQFGGGVAGTSYLNQQGRIPSGTNILNMGGAYNNPAMYLPNGPNYAPLNFYGQSSAYLIPPPGQGVNQQQHYGPTATTNQRPGAISLPHLDPISTGNIHFNVTSQAMSLVPASATTDSSRCNNIYNLLQMQASNNMNNIIGVTGGPPQFSTPSQLASFPTNISLPPPMVQLPSFNMPTVNQTIIEKDVPVNVVITSSDPIPHPNSTTPQYHQQQSTLSVTIPSHHIKHGTLPTSTNNNIVSSTLVTTSTVVAISTTIPRSTSSISVSGFTFRPQVEAAISARSGGTENSLNKSNESVSIDLNKSEQSENAECESQPNFEALIPLPGEIVARTGEEDEEVIFCHRAKLCRHINKEWKDRGTGDIKILKSKDGTARILMRREGTLKICANHKITPELSLTVPENETRGFIWGANDYADEKLRLEMFYIRFKLPETAQKFQEVFKSVQKQSITTNQLSKSITQPTTASTPFSLTKSSIHNFSTSTPASVSAEVSTSVSSASSVFVKDHDSDGSTCKTLFPDTNNKSNLSLQLLKTTKDNSSQSSGNDTAETTSAAAGPFVHFTFGKSTLSTNTTNSADITGSIAPSPFAGIFNNMNKTNNTQCNDLTPNASVCSFTISNNTSPSLNRSLTSETEDDYVPTAQFKPVIPLPDLIEVNTGEENEIVLFEHRAKLLRFDKMVGEWKERGIGNMKLLQDKDDLNKVRLLMRREQVHKLCCNQRLYKDTVFKYATNSTTAITWAAQDFSENELTTEIMTVRFKTADICKKFLDTILKAQKSMSSGNVKMQADNLKSLNKENKQNKENNYNDTNDDSSKALIKSNDFGDSFKPKPGSWFCNDCYVSNTADVTYCAACDAPKDNTVPKKTILPAQLVTTTVAAAAATTTTTTTTTNASTLNNMTKATFNFGFAPLGMNTATTTTTTAAAAAAAAATIATTESVTNMKPTFTFGIGSITTSSVTNVVTSVIRGVDTTATMAITTTVSSNFGDKFKPKADSWKCECCLVYNSVEILYCKACEAPKDDTVPKKENDNSGILNLKNPSQKFQFGFNALQSGNGGGGVCDTFNFSLEKSAVKSDSDTSFPFQSSSPSISNTNFGSTSNTITTSVLNKPNFTFKLPSNVKDSKDESSVSTTTMASGGGESVPNLFSLDKKEFNFVLKPKSPGKAFSKSPLKGGGGDADAADIEDADGTFVEEEENNTYFTPIIPLPDKIEVRTGEEEEELLYIHRAKLYRFTEGDWKERGLGNLKILRHKVTKRLRIVMRREQIFKICLNHVLNNEVQYKRKDEKSWLFVVNDFSEGQVELEKFSLRFKTKDIAEDFMTAVNNALSGTAEVIEMPSAKSSNTSIGSSSIGVTSMDSSTLLGLHLTEEEKEKAAELKLPYEFFTAPSTCAGCRGCDSENYQFADKLNEVFVNQEDTKNPLMPMILPSLTLSKSGNISFIKQSSLAPILAAKLDFNKKGIISEDSKHVNSSTTGIASTTTESLIESYKPINTIFSFSSSVINNGTNEPEASVVQPSSGFLLGGLKSFSSGEMTNKATPPVNIFGGGNKESSFNFLSESNSLMKGEKETQKPISSIFGQSSAPTNTIFGQKPLIFGTVTSSTLGNTTSIFGNSVANAATTANKPLIFGSVTSNASNNFNKFTGFPSLTTSSSGFKFGNIANDANNADAVNVVATTTVATADFVDLSKTATAAIDFASLAAKATSIELSTPPNKSNPAGGFIGLTKQDAFSSFERCKKKDNTTANVSANDTQQNLSENNNDDDNNGDGRNAGENNESEYDPHYEPIIELPDEVVVLTGEEDEEKLFGERAVLFRYNTENKEWKERGVGELKILMHPIKRTYRMVMRREQIFKLILNHAIGSDFKFSQMNNSPKSFVWGTINYAESNTGVLESLAVRFKKVELAEKFSKILNECIKACPNHLDKNKDE